ncbi:MAG: BREX system P-loop protein BrxC [Planctomycetota bacterium]
MLKLKDLFARDIGRRIDPVVKVYDRLTLLEDIRQFVITASVEKSLDRFLDEFVRSLDQRTRGGRGPDSMAVWLAGFFGSGKSHLAKVLGYILENDEIDPTNRSRAMDVFAIHLGDPTLKFGLSLKSALKQIRDKAWCKTIPFEIKSRQDQANPESVTEICLRSFYESLRLCPTIYIARLERRLQREGIYETFLARYRQAHKRSWTDDRREHAFYLDELVATLAEVVGKTEQRAREMVEEYRAQHSRIDPEGFAREVLEYLDEKRGEVAPREPHVLFVIDEMGQFIGDSSDKIEELRAIIEQCGSQGSGRIWFIATSQEALDKVVDRTGLKLSQLGKLDARFSVKISLTSEEIKKVVGERLLRKREATEVRDALRGLYKEYGGYLAELSNLHTERTLGILDEGTFVDAYPMLPHVLPLTQEIFAATRGFKLSGSERNLIGITQGILERSSGEEPGVLVPMDMVFDQVTDELTASDYLGSAGMRAIRESDAKVAGTPVAASRVLKVLWLISRVDWVPRTAEVIAKLLVQRIGADLGQCRSEVEETLERLRAAGYVGRDEASKQYKYLSERERGLEEALLTEIADYGAGVALRRCRDLMREKVLARTKLAEYRVTHGKQGIFEFGLALDNEPLRSAGEITLKVYSSLAAPPLEEIEQENLARGTKGRTIWWISAETPGLVERLKRAEALEKVPQKPRWRNDSSDETLRVLKDKSKELSALEGSIATELEGALRRGRLYYAGEELDLDGTRDLKTAVAEVVRGVVGHLYSRFGVADKAFDEKSISKILQPATKGLARIEPELDLFDSQDHLNRHAALVQSVFEELQRRKDEDDDLSGKALLEHFSNIPFGWPPALVRLVLAAMLRGGSVILEPEDSDQQIFDFTEQGVDGYFTSVNRFKKIRFVPTAGGLTPIEVKEAIGALIELAETGVQESANAIAARLKSKAEALCKGASAAAQKVSDTGLPLPDTYKRAEPVTGAATSKRDPAALVRQFLEDRDKWKEIAFFLDAYERFVEEGCDRQWRESSRVLDLARTTPGLTDGADGEATRGALADLEAIVATCEIVPKWKVFQERYGVVRDRYRARYQKAYAACVQVVKELKDEAETSEVFRKLEKERAATVLKEFFGSGSALDVAASVDLNTTAHLVKASQNHKVTELEALCLAIPGHRKAIFTRLAKELAEQEAPRDRGENKPPRRVHVLNTTRALVGRRFSSAEEFRRFWNGLGDALEAKLKDQVDVEFE